MLRRAERGDRGAGALEYVALLVVGALILGGLWAVGFTTEVPERLGPAVCELLRGTDCGTQDNGTTTSAGDNGTRPADDGGQNPGGGEKKDGGCHGFWGCTWSGTKHVGGGIWGGIKDTGSGIKTLVTTNPIDTGWGLTKYVWSKSGQPTIDLFTKCGTAQWGECAEAGQCVALNLTGPGCILQDMIVDDKVKDDAVHHRWGDMSGRLIWNVGSLFIPTKIPGLNKLGKIAKGADEAGKISKLAKAAQEAEKAAGRAEDLAGKGDIDGAKKAAADAKRQADEAGNEARKNGCKIGSLGAPGLRPVLGPHLGRYAAALPAAPGACGTAQAAKDAAARAQEAIDRAAREKQINQALAKGRYEDADNLIDDARKAATDAEARAKARPTAENKEAARKARRSADVANRRVIDQKIRDALRSGDPGLKAEGDIGQALRNHLVNFQKKIGPNGRLGEIDAETPKAMIESKTGTSERNIKRGIRAKLRNPNLNPGGKPWIIYTPDLDAATAARIARATGTVLVRNIDDLKQALRNAGEPIP